MVNCSFPKGGHSKVEKYRYAMHVLFAIDTHYTSIGLSIQLDTTGSPRIVRNGKVHN